VAAPFTPRELAALSELQDRHPRATFISAAAFARLSQCAFVQRVDVPGRLPRAGYAFCRATDAGLAYQIVREAS
jgi:hypothetical protein